MSTPQLVSRARLRWDPVRRSHVILLPETVLFLTPSAAAIVARCDGVRSLETIVTELTARFPGAPIERDVTALLGRLAARGIVTGIPAVETDGAFMDAPLAADRSPAPLALLAELTYRCPLRCGYCSNPLDLGRARDELDTHTWQRVIDQSAALGVLQSHFSGGEPLVRDDCEVLVSHARAAGLYTNLITSSYGLTDTRLDALQRAGIDHIQVSFQDVDASRGDLIAGTVVHETKLDAARRVRARGIALSVNVVLHRSTVDRTGEFIALAHELGAQRIELANTQYHGWALKNRAGLMPTRAQVERAGEVAAREKVRLRGAMDVVFVRPDYFEQRPKPCMDGWGRKFLTVTPDGRMLPCPGAHDLPLDFQDVRESTVGEIWAHGPAFEAFRGEGWMREPCASCDERTKDFGGCRCQAFALTGDAANTDPVCAKSPLRARVDDAVREGERAPDAPPPPVLHRVRTTREAKP